jgi:hypothetical protein
MERDLESSTPVRARVVQGAARSLPFPPLHHASKSLYSHVSEHTLDVVRALSLGTPTAIFPFVRMLCDDLSCHALLSHIHTIQFSEAPSFLFVHAFLMSSRAVLLDNLNIII